MWRNIIKIEKIKYLNCLIQIENIFITFNRYTNFYNYQSLVVMSKLSLLNEERFVGFETPIKTLFEKISNDDDRDFVLNEIINFRSKKNHTNNAFVKFLDRRIKKYGKQLHKRTSRDKIPTWMKTIPNLYLYEGMIDGIFSFPLDEFSITSTMKKIENIFANYKTQSEINYQLNLVYVLIDDAFYVDQYDGWCCGDDYYDR